MHHFFFLLPISKDCVCVTGTVRRNSTQYTVELPNVKLIGDPWSTTVTIKTEQDTRLNINSRTFFLDQCRFHVCNTFHEPQNAI